MRDSTEIVTQMWFIAGILAPTIEKQIVCLGAGVVIFLISAGFEWLARKNRSDLKRILMEVK